MVLLLMIILIKGVNQPVQIQVPFTGPEAEHVCEQRKHFLIDKYNLKNVTVFDASCIPTETK